MDLEILEAFREESEQILQELTSVIDALESPGEEFPTALLAEFSQKIDRIMGAAKTLAMDAPDHRGLSRIGQIAEVCKSLGYRAAEVKDLALIPVFAGFWADTLEVIGELVESVEDEAKSARIAGDFSSVLHKRLTWLSEKINGAAQAKGSPAPADAMDLEALLDSFGMPGAGGKK